MLRARQIDPNTARAKEVLEDKCSSFVEKAYKNARICKSLEEFVAGCKPEDRPHAILIGSPAAYHGSDLPGADLEVQCLKHFPDVALFIEKPISCSPVKNCYALAEILEKKGTIASVGYMLRYLKVGSGPAALYDREWHWLNSANSRRPGHPTHASDHRGDRKAGHGRGRAL